MARNNKEDGAFMTPPKRLRFRSDLNFPNRVEDFNDEAINNEGGADDDNKKKKKKNETPSFWDFVKVEMARGYMLEHDEERYAARRQKIYSFMRIPRDLERFVVYGIMQCADSFLYIHTFLPIRYLLALWGLITRPIASCFGLRRRSLRLLTPAETCDLLKTSIWIACALIILSVDTNRVYHIIKSQSIIKLYIFYNMLEVGDRLLSAFGQDTMDALFWTATEPKKSKREHIGVITHVILALIYVAMHSFLIMFQATTLNVAVNSSNKALLTIMISNNFVELKGAVFKKFDKNNLFQLTCSDVRERFHLSVLLFIVMIQTMKEFDWSLTQFCVMLPDCFAVLFTEILIDWIKHAFITRFNEIPEQTYREYTTSLAYDMTQTRQKHAFSDHSDLVARRMGFIPFPLGAVLIKAIYSAVSFQNVGAFVVFILTYLFVMGLRILITICALGKACKLMKEHQDERSNSTPSSMTNVPPIPVNSYINAAAGATTSGNATHTSNNTNNAMQTGSINTKAALNASNATLFTMPGVAPLPPTPTGDRQGQQQQQQQQHRYSSTEAAASPTYPMQRSATTDLTMHDSAFSQFSTTDNNATTSTPKSLPSSGIDLDLKNSLELGGTVIFSNSDVDLNDVHLNENVLDNNNGGVGNELSDSARSEPNLSSKQDDLDTDDHHHTTGGQLNGNFSDTKAGQLSDRTHSRLQRRTHKRSESEPSIQSVTNSDVVDGGQQQ